MEAQQISQKVEIDIADHPHACYSGWVYIGYEVELPDGDVDVEYERVRCRRCSEAGR